MSGSVPSDPTSDFEEQPPDSDMAGEVICRSLVWEWYGCGKTANPL